MATRKPANKSDVPPPPPTVNDDEMYIQFDDIEAPVDLKKDSVQELAWKVLHGHLGRGEDRASALGDRYEEVMDEVVKIRLQNGTEGAH